MTQSAKDAILAASNPDRDAVTAYLDDAIRYWRDQRHQAREDATYRMAIDYVDAFQSVRTSLLGELLP